VWALYDIDIVDGKMARIVCSALGDEVLGQVDVQDVIGDAWELREGKASL
jgi:hypothetical protein